MPHRGAIEALMNEVWKKKLIWLWNEWIKSLLIVLVTVGGFRSAIADWNDVPSGSMKPTILEGDRIVVNKLAYDLKVPFTRWRLARWTSPQRGDIVVLFSPADGKRLVKRVVGLPGDRLALRNDRLFINEKPVRYGPLTGIEVSDFQHGDRPARLLATEKLGDRNHPVMITPELPAKRSRMGNTSSWATTVTRAATPACSDSSRKTPSSARQPRWRRRSTPPTTTSPAGAGSCDP
jgi:signal peptidase I